MKKLINWLLFAAVAFFIMSANAFGQDTATVAQSSASIFDVALGFLTDNWALVSGILCYFLYRILPTNRADVVIQALNWIVSLIPDNKKGGGKYKIKTE